MAKRVQINFSILLIQTHAKVCKLASQDVYENVKQNMNISSGPVYVKRTPKCNATITSKDETAMMSETANLHQKVREGKNSFARSSHWVLYCPGWAIQF